MDNVNSQEASKKLIESAIEAGIDTVTYDKIEIKKQQIESSIKEKDEISTERF